MSNVENPTDGRSVFISHRHEESAIASVLASTIRDWSVGHAIPIKVYQSSDPSISPIHSGKGIRDELMNILAEIDVLLLIYTVDEGDWSYCMWETGVATYPKPEDPDTTIIVIKCLDAVPNPFEDQLSISINEEGIKKFTVDFHTDPGFFSKAPGVFAPGVSESMLNRRATQLLHDLEQETAKLRREPTIRIELTPQWIRVGLTLSLSKKQVDEIQRSDNPAEAFATNQEDIKSKCSLLPVPTTDAHALPHFDVAQLRPGTTLWSLVESWRTSPVVALYAHIDWFSEVGKQMMQIIRNRPAQEVEIPFKSANEIDTWYLPVINAAKSENWGCDWEFRLEFYRIPKESQYLNIDISAT